MTEKDKTDARWALVFLCAFLTGCVIAWNMHKAIGLASCGFLEMAGVADAIVDACIAGEK